MKKSLSNQIRSKFQRFILPDCRLPIVMIRRVPAQGAGDRLEAHQDRSDSKVSFDWCKAASKRREERG